MSDQTPGGAAPTPEPTPETTAPTPAAQTAGAAAPPPGVTAGTGGPPPGGGPFKSGKQKTIAMIVAGVIVVGGIGGLIGAMASGGGDDDKNVAAPGEGGSGILNPTPIGNTEPTPSETTEPTPQETTVPSPPPPGDGVTLGGGIATIPVPGGWSVLGRGRYRCPSRR